MSVEGPDCSECGHPSDWHHLNEEGRFACIGFDCDNYVGEISNDGSEAAGASALRPGSGAAVNVDTSPSGEAGSRQPAAHLDGLGCVPPQSAEVRASNVGDSEVGHPEHFDGSDD